MVDNDKFFYMEQEIKRLTTAVEALSEKIMERDKRALKQAHDFGYVAGYDDGTKMDFQPIKTWDEYANMLHNT